MSCDAQVVQQRVFHVLPFGANAEVGIADVCIGILITGSYYLYFLAFRTGLIPYACTTTKGVSVLIAEPSIPCDPRDATYVLMRRVGFASISLFGFGLPVLFFGIMWWYRKAIFVDQLLRMRNEGETTMTNPYISVRRRFRKLYEDYTPTRRYWKLVLIARKMMLASVGILLAGDPALQVRARREVERLARHVSVDVCITVVTLLWH